ncbi:MAG: hypothetical protein J4432_04415 [DPANN group archaeon]|nr:hypothetical protein [DPANN group archaeon]
MKIQIIDTRSQGKRALEEILKKVQKSGNGYAGWKTKKALKMHLEEKIDPDGKVKPIPLDQTEIKKIVIHTIKKCQSENVTSKPHTVTYVNVFPCFSEFVKNKMNGVNGYCP